MEEIYIKQTKIPKCLESNTSGFLSVAKKEWTIYDDFSENHNKMWRKENERKMKLIDLSVAIEDGLPVDPPPQIAHIHYTDHKEGVASMLSFFPGATADDLLDGCGWAVDDLQLSTHTGTHMDAPYHYHPTMDHGKPAWTIEQVPLEWCMGDGVMVDFSDKPNGYVCTSKDFEDYFTKVGYVLKENDIVLVHTNAMSAWGTPKYLESGCGIGREATLWMCKQGVHVVGTDAWSWDAPLPLVAERFKETHDSTLIWEGHKAGAECVYCHMEKLNHLEQLPPYGFQVICFPINVKNGSAGWVRPVAILKE